MPRKTIERLLCIDPGTGTTGWAIFELDPAKNPELVESGIYKTSKKGDWIKHIDEILSRFDGRNIGLEVSIVLIEQPRIFMSGKGQASNNSGAIMKLMGLVFALRQYFLDVYKYHFALRAADKEIKVHLVPVNRWKGNAPKHITAKRVKRYWGHAGQDDNETDAIGIGDWYIRKMKCNIE